MVYLQLQHTAVIKAFLSMTQTQLGTSERQWCDNRQEMPELEVAVRFGYMHMFHCNGPTLTDDGN